MVFYFISNFNTDLVSTYIHLQIILTIVIFEFKNITSLVVVVLEVDIA